MPDEIPWYLNRIRGGWWVICCADDGLPLGDSVLPAALARPEALEEAADRRSPIFMLFARALDMFWLIEPNFKDAAGNLQPGR